MLNLIYVEAALELVPPEKLRHPSVRRNAKRRGKPAEENLLDRSLHHYAMVDLPDSEKRGRPDIIHVCLLESMGSPLNKHGKLRVWINTIQAYTIEIDPSTRPPRDYNRFKSLMEQLFKDRKVPPKSTEPLFQVKKQTLQELITEINPSKTVALSSHSEPSTFEKISKELGSEANSAVLIGAYPSGAMSKDVLSLADRAVSVYPESLETWVVSSRLIYEFEKVSGVYS